MSDRSPSRSRSRSPEKRRERSRSRSPERKRSYSPDRKRSYSPDRKRSRSRSPRSRSRSPQRRSRSGRTNDVERNKVYIGNLNFQTDERELDYHFKRYGKITDIYIPLEKDNGRPRGFAFVTYADSRDAEDAVDDMDEREVDGRVIRVNIARARPGGDGFRKNEKCRMFQRGVCNRGSQCRFSHDTDGGRDRSRGRRSRSFSRSFSRSRSRGRRY